MKYPPDAFFFFKYFEQSAFPLALSDYLKVILTHF